MKFIAPRFAGEVEFRWCPPPSKANYFTLSSKTDPGRRFVRRLVSLARDGFLFPLMKTSLVVRLIGITVFVAFLGNTPAQTVVSNPPAGVDEDKCTVRDLPCAKQGYFNVTAKDLCGTVTQPRPEAWSYLSKQGCP